MKQAPVSVFVYINVAGVYFVTESPACPHARQTAAMAGERIIYHLQYSGQVGKQTSRSLPSRIPGNRFDLEIPAHSQGRFAMLVSLSSALKESVYITF